MPTTPGSHRHSPRFVHLQSTSVCTSAWYRRHCVAPVFALLLEFSICRGGTFGSPVPLSSSVSSRYHSPVRSSSLPLRISVAPYLLSLSSSWALGAGFVKYSHCLSSNMCRVCISHGAKTQILAFSNTSRPTHLLPRCVIVRSFLV